MKISTVKTLIVSAALAVLTVLVLKIPPKAGPPVESTPTSATKPTPKNQPEAVHRAVATAPENENQ